MINWNGYDPENTAVVCYTEKEAKKVLAIANRAGIYWYGSIHLFLNPQTHWCEYKEKTAYKISEKKLTYSSVDFFKREGYVVLDAKAFINWNKHPLKGVPEDTSVEIGTGDDPVNHPSHYTSGKVECIDALEAATVNLTGIEAVCTANAIKYLWRWKQKNGKQDLEKAVWYINKMLK